MKISIALALFILALGVPLGWLDHQRLARTREHHTQLVAAAAQSGPNRDPKRRPDASRGTKRGHENKEEVARKLAADFIANSIAMGGKNGKLTRAEQDQMSDLLASVASLDAAQLKTLFAEVLASKELTGAARRKLLFSLAEVASDHPQAALAMLTECVDLSKEADLAKDLTSASLAKWAREDAQAMLEWVGKNGDIFSKFVDENSKVRIIGAAAVNDPTLALRLIDEIGLHPAKKGSAFREIAQAAETATERTTTLKAISTYLAALPAGEGKDSASRALISGIIKRAAQDGFDAATQWLEHSGMTPEQLKFLPRAYILREIQLSEIGKWVEWMGKTELGDENDGYMREMVRNWTENDPQAAGKWLASLPDGSTKNASISSFAKSASLHDPETAAQWAMTLPPGENRDNTLQTIYKNWPKDDEAAKQAFAKKHGLN